MATTPLVSDSSQLHLLAERLRSWRSSRPRGQRIPAALWLAATDVARAHGLHATAAALKLNYYHLQRRLSGGSGPRKPSVAPPGFVELVAPARPVAPSEPGTLELIQRSGARLTLRLPDARPKDLLPIVQLWLRQGS